MKKNAIAISAACAAIITLASCQSLTSGLQGLTSELNATGINTSEINKGLSTAADIGAQAAKAAEEITPDQEYYLGRAVGARILSNYKPYNKVALNDYLNKLGQSLALYSERPSLYMGYRFMALDSAEVNAFATPSGLVMVSRGLLSCATSEDELAAILAHEIAHITERHGVKAIKSARAFEVISSTAKAAGGALLGADLLKATAAFGDSIDNISEDLVKNGYSQAAEFDADAKAAAILKAAGYDPAALQRVLEAMKKRLGDSTKGFGKTHPTPEKRISALKLGKPVAPTPSAARDKRFAAAKALF